MSDHGDVNFDRKGMSCSAQSAANAVKALVEGDMRLVHQQINGCEDYAAGISRDVTSSACASADESEISLTSIVHSFFFSFP
jgi:hypothetical protein